MSPKKVTLPLDIYVRVSEVKGREGDSFISPKEQVERCRAAAVARGFEVGQTLEELNVSGGKMERPVLNEAIERIRDGASGGILVARIDRFGRTVVGALDAIERINEAGGVVITAEGDFDTSTAVGELVLNMMLSLAQFELRRIRDNWQAAKRRAVERGIHIAPRTPQGYVRADDGRLAPNGKSAETIRNAFAMAAQGDTYSMIAAYLNERELPTWGGDGVWQSNRIKRLLSNRVYLGEARSGNGHVNPKAHEPLVDSQTFELAQRDTGSAVITRGKDVALLASLVRCAGCRAAMKYQRARGASVAIYRCPRHSVHGECPTPSSVAAQRLEDFVIDSLLVRASETRGVELVEGDDVRIEAVEAALAAEHAYKAWLTNTAMQQALGADYDARLLALKGAWDDARADVPAPSRSTSVAVGDLAAHVAELRDNDDIKNLREILSVGMQAVFVRPPKSRAKNLPIEHRVKIVWADDEPVSLPRRGERFEPTPFVWEELT